MARLLRPNSYFLHDEASGDIVGFKDPDGSEVYFARAAKSGMFISSEDQSDDDTPTTMTFNGTVLSNGVTVVDTTKVTVTTTAWYDFQLSVHLHNAASQDKLFELWGRLNGDDIPSSRFIYSVPARHGSDDGTIIPSQNFFLYLEAGDYVEIVWTTQDAVNVTIAKHDAETGENPKPAAPSLLLTVNEIGYA